MSFGDIFSSGRGPGTIGLIMGLIVLGGFGAIYAFVFNADLTGSRVSLDTVVKQQLMEIDDLKHEIETNKSTIKEADKMEARNAKIDDLIAKADSDAGKLEEAKKSLTSMKESMLNTTKEMNTYVANYRTHVRQTAVGEKIPELVSKSGRVYKDVEVRSVSDIGMELRHADGMGRIQFEELSDEWQSRFQFDPEEKSKALAREKAAQDLYNSALKDAEGDAVEETISPSAPMNSEQIQRAIRVKTIEMARLKTDLNRLHAEAVKVETADSIGRSSGNSKANHIRDLRGRIQAVESKMTKVARELGALRTRLPN